jgi:transposase
MASELKIENLDHLGLIAGVIDELGLVELLDELFPQHPQNQISCGQVVKAMVLNCLGFLSAPLYLFSEFFESKAVSHLLGDGVECTHLNDDRIGRVLDQLWDFGLSSLFVRISVLAVSTFEVSLKQMHLDSSSFSVQGNYLLPENLPATTSNALEADVSIAAHNSENEAAIEEPVSQESTEPIAIEVRRGYSRDHRPDLKQFVVNLFCAKDGGVPLFLEVASGNQSDRQRFASLMQAFKAQWDVDSLFIVDAAFYSQGNLEQVQGLRWLSRVPLTIKEAQDTIHADTNTLMAVDCSLKDYKLWEMRSTYGGVEQRWILVESQTRKTQTSLWEKELHRLEKGLNRRAKDLQKQVFACRPDALEALLRFQQSLDAHYIPSVTVEALSCKRAPGELQVSKTSQSIEGYRLRFCCERKPETEQRLTQQRSRFILATNQLDALQYPAQTLLSEYKEQQKVERGFRFLKDPLFFTSSVFVKKTQRVAALAFLMALTLLVYSLAERKVRQTLAATEQTVLDQRKQPTSNPTFRCIIQKFQGIHLVMLNGVLQVTNLTDERCRIIRLLGPPACHYYLIS